MIPNRPCPSTVSVARHAPCGQVGENTQNTVAAPLAPTFDDMTCMEVRKRPERRASATFGVRVLIDATDSGVRLPAASTATTVYRYRVPGATFESSNVAVF